MPVWLLSLLGNKAVIFGLALAATFLFADRRATWREQKKCDAAKYESKIKALEHDAANAKLAASSAKEKADKLESEKENDNESIRKLQARVSQLPKGSRCEFGPGGSIPGVVRDEELRRTSPVTPSRP